MTLVKICGLREPEHAIEAAKAGADFLGMVFAESKRRITPQQCHDLIEAVRAARRTQESVAFEAPLPGEVRGLSWFGAWSEALETALWRWRPLIVGVFADQPADDVNAIADAAELDLVQLSGGEDADYIRRITRPVIRTLHVAAETTAEDILDRVSDVPTAGLHLDTASAQARGGTGKAFDWDIARDVARRLPFLLAGGLTPENVAEAIERVRPWAVDVSSGVETDGRKDNDRIRAFIRAAKGVRV